MNKTEKNKEIFSTKNFNFYICKICGHTVWKNMDKELPENYECKFCKAPKGAFIEYNTDIYNNVEHEFIHITDGVFYIKQNPPFPSPFLHNAYFIEHDRGNILFDAPIFLNKSLLKKIELRGELKYIIHSHNHYLGSARLLCEKFLSQSWLSVEDKPFKDNKNYPDYWLVNDEHRIADGKNEIILKKFPGHTKGSYLLLIKRSKDILLTSDTIYISNIKKLDETNMYFFMDDNPSKQDWLYNKDVDIIGSSAGAIRNAKYYLSQMKVCSNPKGKPTNNDNSHGVILDKEDIICKGWF